METTFSESKNTHEYYREVNLMTMTHNTLVMVKQKQIGSHTTNPAFFIGKEGQDKKNVRKN